MSPLKLASVVAPLLCLAVADASRDQELTKEFPAFKCAFSLPGTDWTWQDAAVVPNAVCVARSTEGLVVMLTVLPVPASSRGVDGEFAANFERGLYASPTMRQRGGTRTKFAGLPCYESRALVNGQLTAVIRVVVANGFAYQVQLLGNTEPVEKRPDFEAIMNSFKFTSPPVVPSPGAYTAAKPVNFAYTMGQIAAACLFAALVLAALGAMVGKKWITLW